MIDINVTIDAVLLYCDESIADINIGNGYSIKKVRLEDIPFKAKITDGRGNLTIAYLGSRIYDDDGAVSLMCLHKNDTFSIPSPQFNESSCFTFEDSMCNEPREEYMDREMQFLHQIFALLRLYKVGNVGTKEVFLEYSFTVMNFFNNTPKQTSNNVERNIVDTTLFTLSEQEIPLCNHFLRRVSQPEFLMLKNIIDEFIWGLEQTDAPTGFEQFTTALEMLLLGTNQQNKKEVLSKRTSVLLGKDNTEIVSIYNRMKIFYRYRSESLHEGDGNNISAVELKELEGIVRLVLNKYLTICAAAIQTNNAATWATIKANQITVLMGTVALLVSQGILPQ